MTTVYFATNRKKDGSGPFDFGSSSVPNDPNATTYAVAEVKNVSLDNADAGTIDIIHDINAGDFSQAVKDKIVGAGHNLLVFIHGADNSFKDAITRAAFNREWLAASGEAPANTTVVAFTWPSSNQFFSTQHTTEEAYKADQTQAGKSGFHAARFLKCIDDLRAPFLAARPGGRIFLLAHSMGNFVLQGAVQGWFDEHGPDDMIFDQVLLAAADEIPDTFLRPDGGRLANLPKLSDRISVYFSRRDLILMLSQAVNGGVRLGFNGPVDRLDPHKYRPAKFRLVDCTDVLDYSLVLESSHQYYRKSETVRTDLVASLVDDPRPDGGNVALATPPAGIDPGAIA
jgi:esterase/lipase superfamily enzyme